MDLKRRTTAFSKLGKTLANIDKQTLSDIEDTNWEAVIGKASADNGWFTPENILFALKNWSRVLTPEHLEAWTKKYEGIDQNQDPKTVGIIMAGNVPLVGFHDFVSVLITGNKVLAKLSSNDKILLPFLAQILISFEPGFSQYIQFTEGKLEHFDAVIATGSNNTSRYFEYYFGKYPHIIRKNRNSVAVLTGQESVEDLELLADDIFRYFGLGCRNVSKIYVPRDYDFEPFFKAMFAWKDIIYNNKYTNNYDYNKAVYLMDNELLLDNEFLLLKKDSGFSSPIAVVFYEIYDSLEAVRETLQNNQDNLQCIVSRGPFDNAVPFGSTQSPQLWDYADGIDTVDFLLRLPH